MDEKENPPSSQKKDRCDSCGEILGEHDPGGTVAVFPSDPDQAPFTVTVCRKCTEHHHFLPQLAGDRQK